MRYLVAGAERFGLGLRYEWSLGAEKMSTILRNLGYSMSEKHDACLSVVSRYSGVLYRSQDGG